MNAPIFMPNLLHLSDLHFGYDQDATARAQRTDSLDLDVYKRQEFACSGMVKALCHA